MNNKAFRREWYDTTPLKTGTPELWLANKLMEECDELEEENESLKSRLAAYETGPVFAVEVNNVSQATIVKDGVRIDATQALIGLRGITQSGRYRLSVVRVEEPGT